MSNGDAMRPYDAGWAHFVIPLAHHRPLPHTSLTQVSEAASCCPAQPGFPALPRRARLLTPQRVRLRPSRVSRNP